MSRPRLIALMLALLALAVYLPAARHGFILYDDGDYVTDNPMVRDGLSLAGIKWAFTTFHSANWHPVTWLSHMADCQWFGINPAGPHCVNVFLHALNTVLVFALWRQLWRRRSRADATTSEDDDNDDAIWPSAFVAALFAVHPLHVESVAWIAERKDVLSTFFGLLTLLCYVRYAHLTSHPQGIENPPATVQHSKSYEGPYGLALFFIALGLMSKPMLVTWPFVMLLLDYWPLQRFNHSTFFFCPTDATAGRNVIFEKLPFFALAGASSVITYIAQNHGAVRSLAAVPLDYRIQNVPVAIAAYLLKMIWPSKLAVIYPMPHAISALAFVGCSLLLGGITAGVWLTRKQYPFLLVGWFWFLGTLVPVIGLVKVGDAAMADRYTYIPSIGIFIIVAFGAKFIAERGALPKILWPASAAVILALLVVVTERQLQYWDDDLTLFGHAVRVTCNNVDALLNYGVALENDGKPLEAIEQYRRARQLAPNSYLACANVADLLYFTGETNAALEQYRQAVKLEANSSTLHDRLGSVLAGLGDFAEATNEFHEAISLDATDPAPHVHLGTALAKQNDLRDATNEFTEALRLSPGDPSALIEWSKALLAQGRDAEAMNRLNQALQLNPDNFQTLTFVARVLASDKHSEIRDGARALDLAKKAEALTGGTQPVVEDVVGMALAESGQFDAAQNAAANAIQLATAVGTKREIIAAMRERLELYRKHQPWRESWRETL
jgi:Flp pilus assembly protein TadD